MNLTSKMLRGKSFFRSINLFVRVLLNNANIVGINVYKNTILCLHFSQNKLKYFVVTDMKQMLT